MPANFQFNDPSLESQWRAIILFGKNSASYKFAFAKALLHLSSEDRTSISLEDLAPIYVNSILDHLKWSDKQGNAASSTFLQACRKYNTDEMSYEDLLHVTEKYGFVNVIDAFQNVNGKSVPHEFYQKDFNATRKSIVITDSLLKLKESLQFENFNEEVEARWNLVETAWNLNINPNMLEVQLDTELQTLYLQSNVMRRKNISSAKAALNGYQKGKCFYSFQDIRINSSEQSNCAIDHFFPHVHKLHLSQFGANVNGIWNLVLAENKVNLSKSAKTPNLHYLERLYKRNEFYIASKHPLGETIINQTGKTAKERISFLQKQYDLSLNLSMQKWTSPIELDPLF